MRQRLGLKCEFVLKPQRNFSESRIRINPDVVDTMPPNWSEETAWDEFADYHAQLMSNTAKRI